MLGFWVRTGIIWHRNGGGLEDIRFLLMNISRASYSCKNGK